MPLTAGTVVDRVTTGKNGNAVSKDLFSGSCLVRVTKAMDGYADTLMSISPVWAFPVVVIVGVIVSVLVANKSLKRLKTIEKSREKMYIING